MKSTLKLLHEATVRAVSQTQSLVCLLKRSENYTEKQPVKLAELMKYNLCTLRAYLLKEDFQQFWTYHSPTWAGKFFDAWCTNVMRSRRMTMKEMAGALRRHRELLLNWFQAKGEISSRNVEGMNNKAKMALVKSYGFKTFEVYETVLSHELGRPPEPDVAHRFCQRGLVLGPLVSQNFVN